MMTKSTSTSSSSCLLLISTLALLVITASADNRIPRWLPQCFRGRNINAGNPSMGGMPNNDNAPPRGIRGILQCIRNNFDPTCFDGDLESFRDIVDCVNDTLPERNEIEEGGMGNFRGLFVNATLECLDPYAACVNATIRDRIQDLKPCVKTSLRELKKCARDNRQECRDSCQGTFRPAGGGGEGNPFVNVAETALTSCTDIQGELMDPLCNAISCCEPCIEAHEEVMDCVVNEVLEIDEVCELECSAGGTRELRGTEQQQQVSAIWERALQEAGADEEEDSVCLEFAPGLTGNGIDELESRADVFLPCVYSEFVQTLQSENAAGNPTMAPDDSDDSGATSPVASSIMFTGVSIMFVLLFASSSSF